MLAKSIEDLPAQTRSEAKHKESTFEQPGSISVNLRMEAILAEQGLDALQFLGTHPIVLDLAQSLGKLPTGQIALLNCAKEAQEEGLLLFCGVLLTAIWRKGETNKLASEGRIPKCTPFD